VEKASLNPPSNEAHQQITARPEKPLKADPSAVESPTPFLSFDQLQTIERLQVNHAGNADDTLGFTIVEETDDERRQRELREEYEDLVEAREYPDTEEDVMEAVLRYHFAKELTAGQPSTKSLRISGRRPSESFLKRFAGDAVKFQFERVAQQPGSYEIYQWKMKPADLATCYLAEHGDGWTQFIGFALAKKEEKWHVQKAEMVVSMCGASHPLPELLKPPNATLKLKPPLRLRLPE
jgi:hypothetical protein